MISCKPPGRSGIFCTIDRATLDIAGWSFFDDVDGRMDAPEAIPCGSTGEGGPFGGCYVPREWEAHNERLEALKRLLANREK